MNARIPEGAGDQLKARPLHHGYSTALGARNLALGLDAPRFHVHPHLMSALCSLVCWAVAGIFVVVAFDTFLGK